MTSPIYKALKAHDKVRLQILELYPLLDKAQTAVKSAGFDGLFDVAGSYGAKLWCHIWPETKADMVRTLRHLAKAGIRHKRYMEPYLNTGCWVYHLSDGKHDIDLFCDLSKSTTCNLVEVGTKTEPVYEVQCS